MGVRPFPHPEERRWCLPPPSDYSYIIADWGSVVNTLGDIFSGKLVDGLFIY